MQHVGSHECHATTGRSTNCATAMSAQAGPNPTHSVSAVPTIGPRTSPRANAAVAIPAIEAASGAARLACVPRESSSTYSALRLLTDGIRGARLREAPRDPRQNRPQTILSLKPPSAMRPGWPTRPTPRDASEMRPRIPEVQPGQLPIRPCPRPRASARTPRPDQTAAASQTAVPRSRPRRAPRPHKVGTYARVPHQIQSGPLLPTS